MGFRNPFRLQVDENDVAYVTDYSPDSQTPQRSRGPSGVGRMEVVRHPGNYGYPICYRQDLGYYRWNFTEFAPGTTTVGAPLDDPPQPIDCGNPNALLNDSRWTRDGGPAFEPGLSLTPPEQNPDIWYSYRDNNTSQSAGHAVLRLLRDDPGSDRARARPPSARGCSPSSTPAASARTARSSTTSTPTTPRCASSRPTTTTRSSWASTRRTRCVRSSSTPRTASSRSTSLLDCGQANIPNPVFDMECDNPMDIQFGSDGSLYLLTYGDAYYAANPDAGLYRFDYVKGQRAPKAVLYTDTTDGALPLTVHFTGSNSSDPDPGDSIRYEWDFGDGSAISTEANPTHTYTKAGRYNAILTVFDSSGQKTAISTTITAGNTTPTVQVIAPIAGGLFSFGDTIQYKVVVTDPEEPNINCNDIQVTFVLGHDSHGHAEQTGNGCTGFLNTIASDVTHGGNVFGVDRRAVHRQGRQQRPGAAADRLRRRRSSARSARRSSSSSTRRARTTATNTDTTGHERRRAPQQPRPAPTGCSSTARSTCSRPTASRSATPMAARAAPSARRSPGSTCIRTRSPGRSSPRRI